jgi:hypothetical protein
MVEGFEEYVTGYPIPGTQTYALAKTWYAPEMERPGCVWTHVLILDFHDLEKISALNQLSPYYRRPVERQAEGYHSKITIELNREPFSPSSIPQSGAADLIAALYGQPIRPTIVGSRDSRSSENLVTAIWAQQWPNCRFNFRFCTGALEARSLEGKPFDLQVVPPRTARELQREPGTFTFLEENKGSVAKHGLAVDVIRPQWVTIATEDLLMPTAGAFRRFLWRYSDRTDEARSQYQKLAEVYILTTEFEQRYTVLRDVTTEICGKFPAPRSALALKKDIYGLWSELSSGLLPQITEAERLAELITSPHGTSFDAADLEIRSRASLLWSRDSYVAGEQLLMTALDLHREQPLASEALAGFADVISANQLCIIAQRRREALTAIVAKNPRLIISDDFWSCRISMQAYSEMLESLREQTDVAYVNTWLPFAIRSGPGTLAAPILTMFGREATRTTLDYIESSGTDSLPAKWVEALRSRQDEIASWLKPLPKSPSKRALAILASILDPRVLVLHSLDLAWWLELGKEDRLLDQPDEAVSAFLLALAFANPDARAVELFPMTFDRVYEAAARERLGDWGWHVLLDSLPTLPNSDPWDRCQQLRRGLLTHFIRTNWTPVDLLRSVRHPDIFREVLSAAHQVERGEVFLQATADAVRSGAVPATDAQREALNEEISRRSGPLRFILNLLQ